MALAEYVSRNVQVKWDGVDIQGLAPDSFVTIAFNTDRTETEVGADGQSSTSILPDNTGTCTIELQYESPSAAVLDGITLYQQQFNKLLKGNLTIDDPSGGVLAVLRGVHIQSAPEITLGSTATGNTKSYTFFVEDCNYTSLPASVSGDLGKVAEVAGAVEGALRTAGIL